jgi:hypothetical protein
MPSYRLAIRGYMPIPRPTDKVVRLETFIFNGKRKQIVRQTCRKRRLIIDTDLVVTT